MVPPFRLVEHFKPQQNTFLRINFAFAFVAFYHTAREKRKNIMIHSIDFDINVIFRFLFTFANQLQNNCYMKFGIVNANLPLFSGSRLPILPPNQ